MVWRALLPPTVAQDDPLWAKRCKEYWERQERLYGMRLSNFTMILNSDEMIVATYAVVMDVLPGERTNDYSKVPVTA